MNDSSGTEETRFETQTTVIDGLTIRYAEQPNPGKDTILLLSPWPESIYAWWPIWPHLANDYSLVAVDLPGFGQSEGRPELMGPKAMGKFIPKVLAALDLGRPHVVGPDIATSALLFTAAIHPNTVASITIGGGAAAYPIQATGLLQQFIEAPSLDPFRGLDPAEVVAGAARSIPGYTAPDFVIEDYIASYAGTRFVDSINYVRSYPSDLAELAPLLPAIQTPVAILAATHDSYLSTGDAEQLHRMIPHSTLTVLDNSHNAWEESPKRYAAAITHHVIAAGPLR